MRFSGARLRARVPDGRAALAQGLASGALAALLLAGGVPAVGMAQEATPASTAICDAPPLPPGTPTALEELEAMGSPEAVTALESDATPEAAAGEGVPADPDTTARVVAAAENIGGCLATGNALGFAALVTPNYLLTEYGTTNPYDLETFLEGFPTFELLAAEDVQTHSDGRLSVVLTTVIGGYQVDRFRAYFVEGDGYLLLDEEVTMPIEEADVTIDVVMHDFSFEMSQDTVASGGLVSFNISNAGAYPHEFAVVRLPEGVTIEQALADPALQDEALFLGGVFAEPGNATSMALMGLEPGTYTAVCFVDIPDGVPHVMQGMVATFTVTE